MEGPLLIIQNPLLKTTQILLTCTFILALRLTIGRRDSMLSAYRARTVKYRLNIPELLNKNEKCLHDKNIPLTWRFRFELKSVYFRRARTVLAGLLIFHT